VRRRRPFLLAAGAAADNAVQLWHVIANTGRQDFRASLAMLPRGAERGALDPLIAARLGVAVGAELTVAPLGADPAAAAARGEQP
jgi:arginine/ornithine N-succinyltransferase beta subunit